MKTHIPFRDRRTHQSSETTDTITILASSESLGWDGIRIEQGYAGLFLPDDLVIPEHYFAFHLGEEPFTWEWKDRRGFKTHTTYPGQIWVNPANTPFTHRVAQHNEFILCSIQPEKMQEAIHDVTLKTRNQFERRYNTEDPLLGGLMQTLLMEANAGNPNGKLFVESLLTAISIHFVKQYSVEDEIIPEYRSGLSRQQLQRTLEYIEGHLTEDISLDALASEVGMSKYHFCRLFKKSTHLTPHQYVIQRRLAQAKTLLKKGELTIVEIAHLLGFSDQSHFSRLFKKRYGLTPGAFLKNV